MSFFHQSAHRALGDNARVLPGALWYFYRSGTTTLASVFADNSFNVELTNPVEADAGGLFPNIYLDDDVQYRAVQKTAAGVTIKDIDPINGESTRVVRLTPEADGAVGDGTADDDPAFILMNARIAAAHAAGLGVIVELAPGATYLAGRQTAGGGTYYREGGNIIEMVGSALTRAKSLIIEGNGATLKFKSGLRYGSFDPSTGSALGVISALDSDAAHIGNAVYAYYTDRLDVRNLNIVGNSAGQTLGGEWGDTGRQLTHTGITALQVRSGLIEGCDFEQLGADGITYGTDLDVTDRGEPFVIRHNRFYRCGRNEISVSGGRRIDIYGNDIQEAGRADNASAPGGYFGTAPKACIDVEEEAIVIRDVSIRNNTIIAGAAANSAIVADSGDTEGVVVESNFIQGNVWLQKANCASLNNKVYGRYTQPYAGDANPSRNLRISGGLLSDKAYNGVSIANSIMDSNGGGATLASPLHIDNLTLEITRIEPNLTGTRMRNSVIQWSANTTTVASGAAALINSNADWKDVEVIDLITASAPASPYWILRPTRHRNLRITSSAGNIRWDSSTGPTGQIGPIPFTSGAIDPASVADGAQLTGTITVTGAAIGDLVSLAASISLSGMVLTGEITATNTLTWRLDNKTGAPVDLGSLTISGNVERVIL